MQFNLGSTVPVCISHVEDTGMFYCQLLENRFEIDQLMLDLQQFYRNNSYQATSLKKGEAVIVRNGKEDVYHRAEIISASRHEVHVKYVDLGDFRKRSSFESLDDRSTSCYIAITSDMLSTGWY